MSHETIIAVATLIASTIATLFTAWITYKTKQLEIGQAALKKTTDETHKLTNSQSLILARQHEVTARSLAQLTGSPDDITQAETATRLRQESEAKQESLNK